MGLLLHVWGVSIDLETDGALLELLGDVFGDDLDAVHLLVAELWGTVLTFRFLGLVDLIGQEFELVSDEGVVAQVLRKAFGTIYIHFEVKILIANQLHHIIDLEFHRK